MYYIMYSFSCKRLYQPGWSPFGKILLDHAVMYTIEYSVYVMYCIAWSVMYYSVSYVTLCTIVLGQYVLLLG